VEKSIFVMKILVATEKPFAAAAVSGIRKIAEEAGHQLVLLEKYTEKSQLIAAVADVDAMIVRSDKVTAEVVAAAQNLKIVVRAGAGYDNLDLAACSGRGIVAMNTPGQNSNAVAELAIAMMIFMSRNQFTPGTGMEIIGKKVGIQAYGNVGRLVAAKAKALGMEVMAFDPFVPAEKMISEGVTPAESLEQMYEQCNFISLHIPAIPETIGSINYDLVSRMPKGGCLVNTARKEVINEAELEKALTDRPDLKYVTDVAAVHQADLDTKFPKQVFATPKKMGAETAEANINAGLAAARQICDFFATGCTKFQLNK
jgi:D-3-phosphoglycerate dehydrogenase